MKYITLADLSRTLRDTFYKVPHDVDFVVGVPRSGVIVGSVIAEWLNVPLIDIDSFCFGAHPTGGRRLAYHTESGRHRKRILVVDDTIYYGGTMKVAREKMRPFADTYDITYMVAYLEGPCSDIDIWLEDVRQFADPFVLYEWNIFHHTPRIMSRCIYDIDGVLCVNPPDERDTAAYEAYIPHATPLFIPSVEIGEIVSYRLSRYEEITKAWLSENGIRYRRLTMFPADTYEDRRTGGIAPAAFKAGIYRQRVDARLFVESDNDQARQICCLAHKPVYCVESNTLYQ